MKKMKKLIAAIASGLMMVMPILGMPMMVNAAPKNITVSIPWDMYTWDGDYLGSTDLPVDLSVSEDFYYDDYYSYTWVCDLDTLTDEEIAEEDWEEDYNVNPDDVKGSVLIYGYFEPYDYFEEGDLITYTIPFSLGKVLYIWVHDCFELVSISGNKVTVKCIDECDYPGIEIIAKKGSASAEEDEFWFKPMKTQLAIAAEAAAASGKEVVAEASGDFALSYEIMKWLENHPNVTLKYTLSYKEKDYNIVIKGGQKLADPNIPWYGPEYLIGKFAK